MKKTSETVVFFGSGPVAAAALERLVRHTVVEAVVTKPQPPHHRGKPPVITAAEQHHLPLVLAANKAELTAVTQQAGWSSRVAVLVDFGIIVDQTVINRFPLGIVNSHFSLLPEWRGADPISFAILSGQAETGVSLMLLVAAMDEGPIIARSVYPIPPDATTPQLTTALIEVSDELLRTVLPIYQSGAIAAVPQAEAALPGHDQPSYARKLTKDDGVLDFQKPASQLEREIRAFSEWPKSRTKLGEIDVVITKAHVIRGSGTPGSLYFGNKEIGIYTTNDILLFDALKPAGKNIMTAEAFLAGYRHKLPAR